MRIACAADLHGHLGWHPPNADLLILAGDLVPIECERDVVESWNWAITKLNPWLILEARRFKHGIVAIPGNHDFWLDEQRGHDRSNLIESMSWKYIRPGHRMTIGSENDHHTLFSLPWTLSRNDWAFQMTENQIAVQLQKALAGRCNVIVSHGPPRNACDTAWNGDAIGSRALEAYAHDFKPDLIVCGHVHEAAGEDLIGRTRVVNCSLLNGSYKFVNQPRVVVLDS